MCFQDDPNSEMTQIHLWQSYQGTFLQYAQSHPHLIAGDFIKNVSNTFSGATAQVAGSNKYVIRGIKPRTIPVDYKGRELVRCQWRSTNTDIVREYGTIFSHSSGAECGGWFGNSASVLTHVLSTHLNIPQKTRETSHPADSNEANPVRPSSGTPSGAAGLDFARAASNATRPARCEWATCPHQPSTPASASSLALLARHIDTHLPDTTDTASWKKRHQLATDDDDLASGGGRKQDAVNHAWQRTLTDELRGAAGVPLGCALVLRNIARAIPKLRLPPAPSSTTNDDAEAGATATNGHSDTSAADADDKDTENTTAAQRDAEAEAELAADAEREEHGPKALMKQIFAPSKDKLFYAMAHNIVLKDYVGIVLRLIAQGGG